MSNAAGWLTFDDNNQSFAVSGFRINGDYAVTCAHFMGNVDDKARVDQLIAHHRDGTKSLVGRFSQGHTLQVGEFSSPSILRCGD